MESQVSIGDYLIKRSMASGVRHVFGVPGDYVLRFFKAQEDSPLQEVNTADEQGAGVMLVVDECPCLKFHTYQVGVGAHPQVPRPPLKKAFDTVAE